MYKSDECQIRVGELMANGMKFIRKNGHIIPIRDSSGSSQGAPSTKKYKGLSTSQQNKAGESYNTALLKKSQDRNQKIMMTGANIGMSLGVGLAAYKGVKSTASFAKFGLAGLAVGGAVGAIGALSTLPKFSSSDKKRASKAESQSMKSFRKKGSTSA